MFKLFVVLLAVLGMTGVLWIVMPSLFTTGFTVAGRSIAWCLPVLGLFGYLAYKAK